MKEKGLSRGKSAAERAKQYMEQSGIQPFLQDGLCAVIVSLRSQLAG